MAYSADVEIVISVEFSSQQMHQNNCIGL